MSGLEKAAKLGVSARFKTAAAQQDKSKPAPPFSLRLTVGERAKLELMANGMSLGAYIRKRLFGDDAEPRKSRQRRPTVDRIALARALSILGNSRLASNLNQIAKGINNGTLPMGPDLEAELVSACADIQTMRDELMRALRTGTEGPS
jgi:hypothetical protein